MKMRKKKMMMIGKGAGGVTDVNASVGHDQSGVIVCKTYMLARKCIR
jgi:hypothetical protein